MQPLPHRPAAPRPARRALAAGLAAAAMAGLLAGCFRGTAQTTGPGNTGNNPLRIILAVCPTCNEILPFDMISFGISRRGISTETNPSALALAGAGRTVVVANRSGTVEFFKRTTTDDISRQGSVGLPPGAEPVSVAVGLDSAAREVAYVANRNGGVSLIDIKNQSVLQNIPISQPPPAGGVTFPQPRLEKIALGKDSANLVRNIFVTDSANNIVWTLSKAQSFKPVATSLSTSGTAVSAKLYALAVKSEASQDVLFVTDAGNSNIYRMTQSASGGTTGGQLSSVTVNALRVLNGGSLSVESTHPSIVYRGDVDAVFLTEEAASSGATTANIALLALKANDLLSGSPNLQSNVNVFSLKPAGKTVSSLQGLAVNRNDANFQIVVSTAGPGGLIFQDLVASTLQRVGGASARFVALGTPNPLVPTELVFTND